MKVLLRIFIPLGILSFIAFGISIPILGTNESWDNGAAVNEQMEFSESYSIIDIDVGAYECTLTPYSGNTTKITVTGDSANRIKAKVTGSQLSVYSNGWGFDWLKGLNILSWFNNIKVEILVPDRQYDYLKVYTGAGSAVVNGISAYDIDLGVGAGKLEFTKGYGGITSNLNIDVSAGKLIMRNATTSGYYIDVSAGSAEVYGLTGSGNIEVSAGNAKVDMMELNGSCNIDVSAGEAVLSIPTTASASINCSKSSGSVGITACGLTKSAEDGEEFSVNGGAYTINANVSSGAIKITN